MLDRTCTVDGCPTLAECRGWCGVHYQHWRRHGDPIVKRPSPKRPRIVDVAPCAIEGCDSIVKARGWCQKHYRRFQRTGSPIGLIRTGPKRPVPASRLRVGPCVVEGCEKPGNGGRGWCPMHYQRWRKNGDPMKVKSPQEKKVRARNIGVAKCSIEGCEDLQKARGWCSLHWHRWRRLGDPLGRLRGEVRDGKRICPGCEHDKPLSEFPPGGKKGRCNRCIADAAAQYRRENPDVMWRQAIIYRARKLGVTRETFDRREIFERDGWVCGICGEDIDAEVEYPDPRSPSIDHIVPLSKGGTHERGNVQASHFRCNLRKSSKVVDLIDMAASRAG